MQRIVSSISPVLDEYRHIVTEDGTIVVNDILASCHTGTCVEDHVSYQHLVKFGHWLANDILKIPDYWKNEAKMHKFRMLFKYVYVYGYVPMANVVATVTNQGFIAAVGVLVVSVLVAKKMGKA